jgi:cell division protein FtsL
METFMIILLAVIAIVLGVLNLKQLSEIEDLEDEINRRKAENDSLMDNIRRLCSAGDKTIKPLNNEGNDY